MVCLAGTYRCAATASLCALLLLGALASTARPRENPPGTAIINPTDRVLEMTVPLHYESYYLGDLQMRITPDQRPLVLLADIRRAVKPLLRKDAHEALAATGVQDGQGYCDLAALRAAGFDLRFDPAAVSVVFRPRLDQKMRGNVSVHARPDAQKSPNAAKPADFSAFVNLRAATDYVSRSPSGGEGLKAPRLDLEGAARWQGMVIEAEATYEADDASLFGRPGRGFKRRGTRMVRDFEDDAVRVTAGDVYPAGTGLQYTPDLMGVSLERSYRKLQPGRNIRPTSRRSFRIERPSQVDVEVNGVTIRSLRLDPGDYDLSDLPISTGLNDIVLRIVDDVGHVRTLEFTVFLDNDLLQPGLSQWALAAGIPSYYRAGEPVYDSGAYFATGFYRRGLSESLTGEAHFQAGPGAAMGGLGMLLGSPSGMISLDLAGSLSRDGVWGGAVEARYALPEWEDWTGRRHSLRLAAKARSPAFTSALPSKDDDRLSRRAASDDQLSLSASYGTVLPFRIAAFLGGGYAFAGAEGEDRYHADLSLNRPLGDDLSMALSGGYYAGPQRDGEFSVLMRLQYRPDRHTRLHFQHAADHRRTSVGASRNTGYGVGSWRTSLDITHQTTSYEEVGGDHDDAAVSGAIQYTGNRANLAFYHDAALAGLDAAELDQRSSLRVETALAYADGRLAVGRPVAGGFAIVAPHAGLAENEIRIGHEMAGVRARTDGLGPLLLSDIAPYTLNRVEFDVDELPPGYDLEDGLFDLQPQYRSGYALQVGSNYTVTALGALHGRSGSPISLLTGKAREAVRSGKAVDLFTNRAGRFTAQGLAPGRWMIEMNTSPVTRYVLTIPEDAVGLYRAGTLKPAE